MSDGNFRIRLRNFVRELRRRKVIRASIAYVIVGAGAAEGAALFLPALGAPEWLPNAVAVMVVLGFPVAMVLAWAFDIVPDVEDETDTTDRAATKAAAPGGSSFRSATKLEGQRFFHYDILERLGVGGMGVVYKARDTRLERIVAIKVLSDHLLADADAGERFLVEAKAAAALDHPNICAIHEVGETEDERFYIAMQYYEGETLRQRIDQGDLQLPEALDIAAQICRGLGKAARQEIIHRDIKPANIILTEDGVAKIVDFGLAKYAGTAVTQTGAHIGTVAYMSPEQTRGDKVDGRTDIWSLGVVLYEMLSGTRPFRGGNDQAVIAGILDSKPEPLSKLVPSIPAKLVSIVERAMHKDPGRRYATASALLKDLEQLQNDPSSLVSVDSMPSLAPEGERRRVTVVACSIEGFDSLLETENPDQVEKALADLQQNVQSVLEEYGGELHEFTEDAFVALFGVPIGHEDDRLRAVRAALEIGKGDADAANLPAGVRLRIAAGSEQVAIRATESGERRYRIGGTVVRDTKHLAALAAPGEILLPPEFARIVEPFVVTERRASVNLVPDQPALTPVAVLGESGHVSRLEASAPGSLTKFVGRDHERAVLSQALQDTQSGNGRFVTVIGDIGVGKSRLLYEFWRSLKDLNIRSTVGRCREQGTLTPLLPFIESMRDMLGLSSDLSDNTHNEVVARTLQLTPGLEDYLPAILHVLSVDSDKYRLPDYLEGEDLRTALGEALISVFTQGASGKPLAMLLEDWHWADESSREALLQLREMVAANPLLVIVTSRPGTGNDSPVPTGDVHLQLTPLGDAAAAQMMSAALNGARIPAELSERIGEKTSGNPFFIEELCRTLLETEALVVEDGEARLSSAIDRLLIPDTVEAVLKSRLDRLDPEAREVLRCAAVIGQRFGLELLKKVVPSRSRIERSLETLLAAGLIQRTGLGKEPTYRFKHALTQDVTYDSLLERQRTERHAVVGAAIEELYGDSAEEYSEQLAVHFAAAEDWDKAISYGLIAAQKAKSLWRLPEAVEVLNRTRSWIQQSDKEPVERKSLLIKLLFDLERHLENLGRRAEQQQAIDDLSDLVPTDVPTTKERGEIFVRQSDLHTLSGRFTEARPPLDEALQIADQLDDLELRGKVLRSLGHLLWLQGDYDEAVPWLEEAVKYSRAHDNTTRLIADLINLGRALKLPEAGDRAMAIGDEALALANDTGTLVDQGYVYHYKGHVLRAIGQIGEAIEAFEESARLTREARVPVREVFNTLGAAALYLELGQLDKGMKLYQESVQLARRVNRADQLAHALVLWGEALVTCAQSEDAIPNFEEAVGILRRIGNEEPLAATLVQLASAQQRAGRAEAEATWRQALELHERLGDQAGAMVALERLAGLQRAADQSESHWSYRRALAIAAELEDRAAEARIRNSLAVSAWQAGELDEAEKQYRKAAALIRGEQDKDELGVVLNGLGAVLVKQDQASEALEILSEALATNREFGQDGAEADSLAALGAAARAAGKLTEASSWYQQCIERRRFLGDRAGEGWALQRLSEVSKEAGEIEQAGAFSAAALAIGREIGDKALESLASKLQSIDPRSRIE
jgi:serine/threonine protein kinase/tetratricopeptide (TPR) repeat protein